MNENKMVTRKVFDATMVRIDKRFAEINEQLDGFRKNFLVINARFNHIDETIADIKENMYTKQDHARDMVWMDKAMEQIEAAKEERILSGRQSLRMDDRLYDHEKRIRALEKKAV